MPLLSWLWDKIAGNFLWSVMLAVGGFLFSKIRPWLMRAWQWVIGLFQKKAAPGTQIIVSRSSKLDALGVWCLVLAIVLLAFWNRKLERDVHRVQVEMVRYVLPRQLSKEEIETFGKYLSSHSQPHEVTIKYVSGDAEAQRYASDFSLAFSAGNWLPQLVQVDSATITCNGNLPASISPLACSSDLRQMKSIEGASILQTGPNPPQPSTLEEKLHPPALLTAILSQSLNAADIQGIDVSYSNTNDPLNTVTVFVGRRPRDKWAVLPSGFFKRFQGRSPQDITDDDFK